MRPRAACSRRRPWAFPRWVLFWEPRTGSEGGEGGFNLLQTSKQGVCLKTGSKRTGSKHERGGLRGAQKRLQGPHAPCLSFPIRAGLDVPGLGAVCAGQPPGLEQPDKVPPSVRRPPTLGPASSAPRHPRRTCGVLASPATPSHPRRSPLTCGARSTSRPPPELSAVQTSNGGRGLTRLPWRRPAQRGPQAPSLTQRVLRLRAGHLQRCSARSGPQSCPAARPPLPGVGDTGREVVGRCGHGESRCMRRTSAGWRERAGPADGLGSLWRTMGQSHR